MSSKQAVNTWEKPKPKVRIGVISGLFHGDAGERQGLWHKAAEKFKDKQVNFVILVGGLIRTGIQKVDIFGERTLNMALRVRLELTRESHYAKDKGKWTKYDREAAERGFIEDRAKRLAQDIPQIDGIKIYIVTSPALDKTLGRLIAEQLADQRKDIWLWGDGDQHFDVKQVGLILGVFAPDKTAPPFRIKYYGAPIQRRLLDAKKGPVEGLGDINIVGGHSSVVFHPGDSVDDVQKPFLSAPSLYSISKNRTAENQTGVCILNFYSNVAKEVEVVNYSLKDLVANEWKFIKAPNGTTRAQKAVIKTLKDHGRELTIGRLEDFAGYSRDTLVKEIDDLKKFRRSSRWPGIAAQKIGDNRYFFNVDWVREKTRYTLPPVKKAVDRLILFSCLHAGCKHTDMRYFIEEVPRLMLENGVKYLVSAGDFIEGEFHGLHKKGELVGSRFGPVNYTYQESLAAWLVGTAIAKVFDELLFAQIPSIKTSKRARVNRIDLAEAVQNALIDFPYIPGNHCRWTEYGGMDALARFEPMLETFIMEHIEKTLWKAGLCIPGIILRQIVRDKLTKLDHGEEYKLPSGLPFSIYHPSLSRTITATIRIQSALASAKTLLVLTGNYHTGARVEEWDNKNKQRVGLEAGALKISSRFEDERLKTIDFGVAYLETTFARNQIVKTATRFFGEKRTQKELDRDNNKILNRFEKWHYQENNNHK
ncbi:hypothetical protein MYX06_01330 [Patescibacteria group bacterium AH-259-L05]|nr:hypothetical protein [Patescibacteria group bacterium AH-259-L05]